MNVSSDGKDDMNTVDIDQDGRNKSDDIGEELKEHAIQDIAVEPEAQPKIEAPTAQNLKYLNSLDNNNSKPMGLEDLDRKLAPPSDAVNESELQSPVVPQFVHIPIDNNNATLLNTTKHRAPSVPDLISYSHSHERTLTNTATTTLTTNNVPLSNDILSNKKDNRESRKEQFEERLRRAHLRLKSDATGDNNDEEEVTRYRSRSTPSRHLRVDNTNNEGTTDNRRSSLYNSFGHNTTSNTGILLPPDTSELETSVLAVHMSIESSAPAEPISPNIQQQESNISNIAVEDTPNSMLVATNSSCKSSHGSRVSDEERNDSSIILEPPPPPPPATEKERLVERERQARLETERARRRQLALQRDRQSEDVDNDNNADLLLGDVSFDAGLEGQEMAPEFVGDNNGVVLDLPISSADSNSSIPRPPIPPPPATERERLVERERQARLETERARRRHLALQRERDDTSSDDDIKVDESNSVPPTSPQTDMNSREDSRPLSTTRSGEGIDHDQAEVPNTEAEANLSYPMERFLDRVDDEEDPSSTLPVDIVTEENNAEPSLPYTMELFLADNVAVSEQNESTVDATRFDTSLAHEPNNSESVVDGISIQPSIDDQSHQNEPSQAATQSDRSAVSINASTDNPPISEVDDMAQFNYQGDNQSAALSSSRLSMASSHDASHHTPHLTEAEIAHLNEVDHASIGNAAPNSVRDEPSEASVSGRVIDHAFSIATQPTAIESVTVTEVSDHRGSIVESDVIRVEGPNISVQNSSSGGASAASVAAMPSVGSNDDSSHVSDDITGSHDNIGMPRLTEAGIGTLADIENASLGPAPPQSVRDERLSESSVAERGEHQFSSTDPITEISSVDKHDLLMMDNSDDDDSISDDQSENASVEAMPSDQSDQSVETPRVYHGEHRMHIDSDDEEMIVYQPSIVGSSASIEALPSIDESATHDYGAFHSRSFSRNSVEGFGTMDHQQYDRDIESAPLLTPTGNEDQAQALPPAEPHSITSQHATITPTLIVGIGTGFAVGLGLGIGLGLVRSLS